MHINRHLMRNKRKYQVTFLSIYTHMRTKAQVRLFCVAPVIIMENTKIKRTGSVVLCSTSDHNGEHGDQKNRFGCSV